MRRSLLHAAAAKARAAWLLNRPPPPPPSHEARVELGPASTPSKQSNANGRGVGWRSCPAWLPLSDEATSLFLSKVADTLVMGLVTLATFSSTYLLAWGKPGTNCIPPFNRTISNGTVSTGEGSPGLSGPQIFVGLLPFAVLPITLFFSGLAKMAEVEKRALGFVSAICFCEFTLAIALGGLMSHCITGTSFYLVLGCTVSLILMMGVIWMLTFKYPKILRGRMMKQLLKRKFLRGRMMKQLLERDTR